MSSRLYRSIIVFGTSLGIGAGVATVVTGCDLYLDQHHKPNPGPGPWSGIDAGCGDCDAWHPTIADAPWGIIDAPQLPDAAKQDAG